MFYKTFAVTFFAHCSPFNSAIIKKLRKIVIRDSPKYFVDSMLSYLNGGFVAVSSMVGLESIFLAVSFDAAVFLTIRPHLVFFRTGDRGTEYDSMRTIA